MSSMKITSYKISCPKCRRANIMNLCHVDFCIIILLIVLLYTWGLLQLTSKGTSCPLVILPCIIIIIYILYWIINNLIIFFMYITSIVITLTNIRGYSRCMFSANTEQLFVFRFCDFFNQMIVLCASVLEHLLFTGNVFKLKTNISFNFHTFLSARYFQ